MSHSRKNSVDQNLFLLQKDLKSNYTRGQLQFLAEHYEISTRLNKERLTMEIAKANLKSSKKKARMPPSGSAWPFEEPPSIPSHLPGFTPQSLTESQSKRAMQEALARSTASSGQPMMEMASFHGTEGNVHLNKQSLQRSRQDCMNHVEQLQRTTQETLATISSGRTKMYDELEKQTHLEPQEFEDIISKVNLVCSNELNDIENCITSALTKSVESAKAFIASVPDVAEGGTDELLAAAQEVADALEALKVGLQVTPTVPGLSSPEGLGMQSAPVPVQSPFAISTPPSAPAVLPGQEPQRVLFPPVEETITPVFPTVPPPSREVETSPVFPAVPPPSREVDTSPVFPAVPPPSREVDTSPVFPAVPPPSREVETSPVFPAVPPPSPTPSVEEIITATPTEEEEGISITPTEEEEGISITPTPEEEEVISITPTPEEEEVISITPTPERPLVYPSSPTAPPPSREVESHTPFEEEVITILCESDQDCEEAQREGRLSGLHQAQRVICVTKRDGTPDCAYQA